MVKRKEHDDLPPWSDTPLDHWSKDIDPVIMAGDEWVDEAAAPGAEILQQKMSERPPAPFLHPMHDTSYGGTDHRFLSEDDTP